MSKLKIQVQKTAASVGNWEDVVELLADQFIKDQEGAEGTNPQTWNKELGQAKLRIIKQVTSLVERIQYELDNGDYSPGGLHGVKYD